MTCSKAKFNWCEASKIKEVKHIDIWHQKSAMGNIKDNNALHVRQWCTTCKTIKINKRRSSKDNTLNRVVLFYTDNGQKKMPKRGNTRSKKRAPCEKAACPMWESSLPNMGKPRAQFRTISPMFEKTIWSRHRLTASDARKVTYSCHTLKATYARKVICISPTGENERGLKSVEKNTIQMITIA